MRERERERERDTHTHILAMKVIIRNQACSWRTPGLKIKYPIASGGELPRPPASQIQYWE